VYTKAPLRSSTPPINPTQQSFSKQNGRLATHDIPYLLIEIECSFPSSQKHTNGHYPKPHECSPPHHNIPSDSILHLAKGVFRVKNQHSVPIFCLHFQGCSSIIYEDEGSMFLPKRRLPYRKERVTTQNAQYKPSSLHPTMSDNDNANNAIPF
jgi:hypothetical protein